MMPGSNKNELGLEKRTEGLLIFNPGAGDQSEELLSQLTQHLAPIDVQILKKETDLQELTSHALQAGYSYLVVAGGDGTVEGVAVGLLGTRVPLGIIPVGTYNNFARSLGVPEDWETACQGICKGVTRSVAVAYCNGEPFFECVGCGLDAALFPTGEAIKQGGIWKWLDLFRMAYLYRRNRYNLILDRPVEETLQDQSLNFDTRSWRRYSKGNRQNISVRALLVTVSKGPYYGMNFAVAPDQTMEDDALTISLFHRYSKWELWLHFFSIAFGRRSYNPKTVVLRASTVTIKGKKPIPTHLDGRNHQEWPLEISVHSAALEVFEQKIARNT